MSNTAYIIPSWIACPLCGLPMGMAETLEKKDNGIVSLYCIRESCKNNGKTFKAQLPAIELIEDK